MDSDRSDGQSRTRRLALAFITTALLAWSVPAAHAQTTATGARTETPPGTSATPQAVSGLDLRSLKITPQNHPDGVTRLDFEATPIFRTSNQRMLTITAGDTGIRLPVIRASGGFVVAPTHCELGPHDSCALSVSFSPRSRGAVEGAIELSAPNGPTRVIATAKAIAIGPDEQVLWWLALAYICAMLFFRWNMIALPARNIVQAQIAIAIARAEQLKLGARQAQAQLDNVIALLDAATDAVTVNSKNPLDYLFWSRGLEVKSLVMMHAAELMMVPFLSPEDVRSRLERAESELRDVDKPGATEIAETIRTCLGAAVAPATSALRATIMDIRSFLHQLSAKFFPAMARFATPFPNAAQLNEVRLLLTSFSGTKAASLGAEIAAALKAQTDRNPAGQQMALEESTRLLQTLAEVAAEFNTEGPMPQGRLAAAAHDFGDALHALSARIDTTAEVYPLLRWRALLTQALGYLNDRYDTDDATLLSWQNKTVWLTTCGTVLIIALSIEHGNGALFVLGGVGGLLSRLSRSLYRQDMPTDYGSSWTTLFMSVVVGALAGWCGILLVHLMINMGLLGTLFQSITWENSYNPVVFGMAILFGFSERQFDSVLSSIGANLGAKDRSATAPAPTVAPLAITSTDPDNANVGKPFTLKMKASGGVPPYVWRLTAPIPKNTEINPETGVITLTPKKQDRFDINVHVVDQKGAMDSKKFVVTAV